MTGDVHAPAARVVPKIENKVRPAIRESAKGEQCTVRIACWGDVIWSHARWPSAAKGGATKAFDLCGAYACLGCDAIYDGQKPAPTGMTRDDVDLAWAHGHMRSMVRLAEKGLI